MDVIVRSNNDPVNDMTAPVSWLINDLDNVTKTTLQLQLTHYNSTQLTVVLKYLFFLII